MEDAKGTADQNIFGAHLKALVYSFKHQANIDPTFFKNLHGRGPKNWK